MNKLYINVEDYQGGDFAVGETLTAKDWKERVLQWCDSDGAEELYDYYKNFDISNEEKEWNFIQDISETWQIYIVPYDKNNEEHRILKEEYEGE